VLAPIPSAPHRFRCERLTHRRRALLGPSLRPPSRFTGFQMSADRGRQGALRPLTLAWSCSLTCDRCSPTFSRDKVCGPRDKPRGRVRLLASPIASAMIVASMFEAFRVAFKGQIATRSRHSPMPRFSPGADERYRWGSEGQAVVDGRASRDPDRERPPADGPLLLIASASRA